MMKISAVRFVTLPARMSINLHVPRHLQCAHCAQWQQKLVPENVQTAGAGEDRSCPVVELGRAAGPLLLGSVGEAEAVRET